MKASEFKKWRKSLGLSQKQAAQALGLKRRIVQYYEKGERDGDKIEVPKTVRLACFALTKEVCDYHGPDTKMTPTKSEDAVAPELPGAATESPKATPEPPKSARKPKRLAATES